MSAELGDSAPSNQVKSHDDSALPETGSLDRSLERRRYVLSDSGLVKNHVMKKVYMMRKAIEEVQIKEKHDDSVSESVESDQAMFNSKEVF